MGCALNTYDICKRVNCAAPQKQWILTGAEVAGARHEGRKAFHFLDETRTVLLTLSSQIPQYRIFFIYACVLAVSFASTIKSVPLSVFFSSCIYIYIYIYRCLCEWFVVAPRDISPVVQASVTDHERGGAANHLN